MREGWVETTLGEVALVNPKEAPLAEDDPFVPMDAVDAGGRWVTYTEPRGTRGGARARGGDTLFARITPCLENGKIGQVPYETARVGGSTELVVLRAGPQMLPDFLFIWSTWSKTRRSAEALMTGTTGRQRVSAGDLAKLELALPPLVEQRRIVDLIAAVDASIEAANATAESVDSAWLAIATGALQSVPERTPLDSIVEVTMGRQRAPKHASGDHMVPYLRAANVKDGRLALGDILEMNFTPAEQQTFALRLGDVLVTEGCGSIGQLGASARWSGELDGPVCMQNTLLRLRARPGLADPAFVEHLARFAHRSGLWASIASGTNIFHIGSERAKKLEVPLLGIGEQHDLAATLNAVEELRRSAVRTSESLREVRICVLTELLSGNHEIPESYDALLEDVA